MRAMFQDAESIFEMSTYKLGFRSTASKIENILKKRRVFGIKRTNHVEKDFPLGNRFSLSKVMVV